MSFNIAIDGPAGAGKSTIAKKLAKKISFIYVDTGAMYRAMGYYFLQHGIRAEEEEKIKEACDDISVALAYENDVQKVLLNGEDISDKIRQEKVGNMASATSGYGFVRAKLLSLAAGYGSTTQCHYGWQRYRNVRSAECPAENIPDCQCGSTCKTPL